MTNGNALAQKILANNNSGTIEVGIKGMVQGGSSKNSDTGKPATYKGEKIPTMGGRAIPPLHADVPLVTLKWGDGQKWQGTPNLKLMRGATSYKAIMTFDVCKKEVNA